MTLPKRKQNRLCEFDYSSAAAYFITICTAQRKPLLRKHQASPQAENDNARLSAYGRIVDQAISNIPNHYPAVSVDRYVIMADHVHLLLQIHTEDGGRPMAAPTISTVINQMKGFASKRVGFSLWQKGFHDHIIRGDRDYLEAWEYIEGNPCKENER